MRASKTGQNNPETIAAFRITLLDKKALRPFFTRSWHPSPASVPLYAPVLLSLSLSHKLGENVQCAICTAASEPSSMEMETTADPSNILLPLLIFSPSSLLPAMSGSMRDTLTLGVFHFTLKLSVLKMRVEKLPNGKNVNLGWKKVPYIAKIFMPTRGAILGNSKNWQILQNC